MTTTQQRTLFISASPIDAYRKWKSYWGLTAAEDAEPRQATLLVDVPNRALGWSGRLGLAQVHGRADFIPAQGGCVVHFALTGSGALAKLVLSPPLERFFWRTADGFRAAAEGLTEGAV